MLRKEFFKQSMPLNDIDLFSKIRLRKLKIIVTTTSKSGIIQIQQCRKQFEYKRFILRFAVPENDKPHFISDKECIFYPKEIAGNIYKIRKWLEETQLIPFILSDDDPGSNFQNKGYVPKYFRTIIPDITNKCGAKRLKTTSKQLYWIWNLMLYLGRKFNCAYVGLNTSEQQLSSIPGFETTGACPKRSFGTYGLQPFRQDIAITGAAGILKKIRKNVSPNFQNIHQEWATASITAIAGGFHTLMYMPIQANYAVKPPKDVVKDIERLRCAYPDIIEPANTAGQIGDVKTGCIIHLKTAKEIKI